MEKNLYLYNGKDYWLIPKPKSKEIIMVNIQTRHQTKVPMATTKAVKENYECWLENQEIRLPRSFIIKAKDYTKSMAKDLELLGFKKHKKKDLRKLMFFHLYKNTYTVSHIDEIDEPLIPTLNYQDIKKIAVSHEKEAESIQQTITRRGVGLFANQNIQETII